jgi:hypothetical protein
MNTLFALSTPSRKYIAVLVLIIACLALLFILFHVAAPALHAWAGPGAPPKAIGPGPGFPPAGFITVD